MCLDELYFMTGFQLVGSWLLHTITIESKPRSIAERVEHGTNSAPCILSRGTPIHPFLFQSDPASEDNGGGVDSMTW
jgi:hypothetical protein